MTWTPFCFQIIIHSCCTAECADAQHQLHDSTLPDDGRYEDMVNLRFLNDGELNNNLRLRWSTVG